MSARRRRTARSPPPVAPRRSASASASGSIVKSEISKPVATGSRRDASPGSRSTSTSSSITPSVRAAPGARWRSTRAGIPPATTSGGTERSTMLPAVITERAPITTPGRSTTRLASQAAVLDRHWCRLGIRARHGRASLVVGDDAIRPDADAIADHDLTMGVDDGGVVDRRPTANAQHCSRLGAQLDRPVLARQPRAGAELDAAAVVDDRPA